MAAPILMLTETDPRCGCPTGWCLLLERPSNHRSGLEWFQAMALDRLVAEKGNRDQAPK